jgi:hypothetical protein
LAKFKKNTKTKIRHCKKATSSKERVFMGDSITEFWSISTSFFSKIFISIAASAVKQLLKCLFVLERMLLLQPAVHILAGINDIAGNTGPMTLEMIANIFRWLNWQKQTKLK